MKGIGCLEDVVTTNPFEHNGVFNPYTAGTQVNTYLSDKQEDKTPNQQIKGNCAGTNVAGSRQGQKIGNETPKTEIMKSRSGEMRTRSGHINHRLERLGINQ